MKTTLRVLLAATLMGALTASAGFFDFLKKKPAADKPAAEATAEKEKDSAAEAAESEQPDAPKTREVPQAPAAEKAPTLPETIVPPDTPGVTAPVADKPSIFDRFLGGITEPTAQTGLGSLSQDQMVGGLKDALSKGVHTAVDSLGKEDGFLGDLDVKIPMPESLEKIEKTLRSLGQDKYADEFVTTMNRAAEHAVPEAAAVLGDSVKQMTIADAKAILTGGDTAATDYFRRTSSATLKERLLPIVKSATEKVGVTSAYKGMANKAGGMLGDAGTGALGSLGGLGNFGGLGGVAGNMLGGEMPDIDAYITDKALDGLFLKIAEQETLIRADPVARTTDLLKKVFGSLGG